MRRHAWVLALLAGLGCSEKKKQPPDAGVQFDRAGLLAQVADCTMARQAAFQSAAAALKAATAALAATPTPGARASARDAWRAAMAAWEEVEVFRFGPAASTAAPGGKDLRDQIYSWPLVSRCRADEQIVSQAYASPGFGTSLVNGRGLGALEYLLFYEGADNGCDASNAINTSGSWAALGAAEIEKRKADYAAAAAADVAARAGALVQAWDAAGGNFRGELITAGAGSKLFSSQQAALNAVSDGMFYVEQEVKDWKLGKPLGLTECATATCPEALESQWAKAGAAHLESNLIGFRRLYQGCSMQASGFGFEDWLVAANATDAAARLTKAVEDAQSAVAALAPSMEDALRTDPARVRAAHTAIKSMTDILKTEFVSVLDLELPKGSEGDND